MPVGGVPQSLPSIDRLMKAGAMAYLTKPLDVVEFFRVVDKTTATGGTTGTRQKHSTAVLAINED
jgi:FixJ family two-component response regulator